MMLPLTALAVFGSGCAVGAGAAVAAILLSNQLCHLIADQIAETLRAHDHTKGQK